MDSLAEIQASKLFSDLNAKESQLMSQALQEKIFAEGETVFIEQMPGEALYIVVEGTIRISKMLAEGDEQILAVLGPEDSFGEMALIDQGPRLATARVAENARLAKLSRSHFEQLAAKSPTVGFKLLRNVVRSFAQKVRDNQEEYRQILLWTLDR